MIDETITDALWRERRNELDAALRRTERLERLQRAYQRIAAMQTTNVIPQTLVEAARALAPEARIAIVDRNQVVAAEDHNGPCKVYTAAGWRVSLWATGQASDLNAPMYSGIRTYACGAIGKTRLVLYIDDLAQVDESFEEDFLAFTAFAGVAIIALRMAEADRKAATTDALTQLPNRRALETYLRTAIADQRPFTYAIIDLDKFKQINDTYGHQAGDALLRKVGQTLRERTRATDFPARLAGDEFVLLLAGSEGDIAATRVRSWFAAEGINASVGIARFPQDARDAQGLYKFADQQLYEAKKHR